MLQRCSRISFLFKPPCLIQLPGYYVLHQIIKNLRGKGINIFVHESLSFKKRQDLGINSEAFESLSIEILNKTCKNEILNTIYRSPNGDIEACKKYFKNLFAKNDTVNKHIVSGGDFNLNVLDFGNYKKGTNLHKTYVSLCYDTNHKQTQTSNGKYGNCHQPYCN